MTRVPRIQTLKKGETTKITKESTTNLRKMLSTNPRERLTTLQGKVRKDKMTIERISLIKSTLETMRRNMAIKRRNRGPILLTRIKIGKRKRRKCPTCSNSTPTLTKKYQQRLLKIGLKALMNFEHIIQQHLKLQSIIKSLQNLYFYTFNFQM
jgi:hypothetical protein